jgi:hypothetical protein
MLKPSNGRRMKSNYKALIQDKGKFERTIASTGTAQQIESMADFAPGLYRNTGSSFVATSP